MKNIWKKIFVCENRVPISYFQKNHNHNFSNYKIHAHYLKLEKWERKLFHNPTYHDNFPIRINTFIYYICNRYFMLHFRMFIIYSLLCAWRLGFSRMIMILCIFFFKLWWSLLNIWLHMMWFICPQKFFHVNTFGSLAGWCFYTEFKIYVIKTPQSTFTPPVLSDTWPRRTWVEGVELTP